MTPWDLPPRLRRRVRVTESGCWLWTGPRTAKGYGVVSKGASTSTTAHRMAYEALVSAIPDGHQIDHLCRVTPCCNPQHLEPVTPTENVWRSRHY